MSALYVVQNLAVTISTAITIIQIKAGANNPLEIIRAHISQKGSTTSVQEGIKIVRKSSAATVTSFTPLKLDPSVQAAGAVGSTSATGITGTAEGTDTDVLIQEGFNVLSGWTWLPVPEERIVVPVSGIIALKFTAAPASQTWNAYMVFRELG